jgi:hypothetical protein
MLIQWLSLPAFGYAAYRCVEMALLGTFMFGSVGLFALLLSVLAERKDTARFAFFLLGLAVFFFLFGLYAMALLLLGFAMLIIYGLVKGASLAFGKS